VDASAAACTCSLRINATTRLCAPGSANIALCPTPISEMFWAPSSSDDVCGAAIESCHDQIDDTGGISNGTRWSSSSHSLLHRSSVMHAPRKNHAWALPWYGVASEMRRRIFSDPYF